MKRTTVFILILICAAALSACGKKGTPEASPTSVPTHTPTPTEIPISPVPMQTTVDPDDFFEILRLLAPGTKVDLKGMSDADIERCFYIETYSQNLLDSLKTAGLYRSADFTQPVKFRGLLKISDTEAFIGEMLIDQKDARKLIEKCRTLFAQAKDYPQNPSTEDFAKALAEAGQSVKSVYVNNRYYYVIETK